MHAKIISIGRMLDVQDADEIGNRKSNLKNSSSIL